MKEIKQEVAAFAKLAAKLSSRKAEFSNAAFKAFKSDDGETIQVKIDYRKATGLGKGTHGIAEMCEAMEAAGFHDERMEHGSDNCEMYYELPNTAESVATVQRLTAEMAAAAKAKKDGAKERTPVGRMSASHQQSCKSHAHQSR